MKLRQILISAAAVIAAGTSACAAGADPMPPPPPPGMAPGAMGPGFMAPPGPMMMLGPIGPGPMSLVRFDSNKDGVVTRAEIDRGTAEDFKDADTDRDGKLDAGETKAYFETLRAEHKAEFGEAMPAPFPPPPRAGKPEEAPRAPRGDHRGPPMPPDPLKRADWNLDGALSLEEFAAPLRMMALHADRDGDGKLSKEELTPPRPPHPPGMGPGHPPPPPAPPPAE